MDETLILPGLVPTTALTQHLDILTTVPAYEANPVTVYMWGRIGFLLSALFKIGLVLSFGLLFTVGQKIANPNEWKLAKKIFLGLLKILVAFYVFVVAINIAISTI